MSGSGTALITGASAGIGAALSREFAAHGHDVVMVARREERLQALADELSGPDVTATPLQMDLDYAGAAVDLHEAVKDRGLDIDVLVNNVGVGTYGPFAESDLDKERAQLRLNVVLPVELTRLFMEDLEGGGHVVNLGSVAGFQPGPYVSTYYASKAYINNFSEAIAEELQGDVTVTVVCPGPVDTEFHRKADRDDSSVGARFKNTPEAVAEAAYEGTMAGETVVVPSRPMRVLELLSRVAPRPIRRRLAARVNSDR